MANPDCHVVTWHYESFVGHHQDGVKWEHKCVSVDEKRAVQLRVQDATSWKKSSRKFGVFQAYAVRRGCSSVFLVHMTLGTAQTQIHQQNNDFDVGDRICPRRFRSCWLLHQICWSITGSIDHWCQQRHERLLDCAPPISLGCVAILLFPERFDPRGKVSLSLFFPLKMDCHVDF